MENNIIRLKVEKNQLLRGCILASIAHAIMVAQYPELSHEQSWDGMNYSIQDSEGSRGTVTFHPEFLIAAFRNDNSKRLVSMNKIKKAEDYFIGAPYDIIKLATTEALQYLLYNLDGKITPLITTAFWGSGKDIFSQDSLEEIIKNGGGLIEKQILDINDAIDEWIEYYDMTHCQADLLESIFKQKTNNVSNKIVLTRREIALIGCNNQKGLNESRISFGEIGVLWED